MFIKKNHNITKLIIFLYGFFFIVDILSFEKEELSLNRFIAPTSILKENTNLRLNNEFLERISIRRSEWIQKHGQHVFDDEFFQNFYNKVLTPLMNIFQGKIDTQKWNESTWVAFQDYKNKTKLNKDFYNKAIDEKLNILKQIYQEANISTLELLIKADEEMRAFSSKLLDCLSKEEINAYFSAIHNIGYYGPQYSRTQNSKDLLLPVEKGGALKNNGFINGFDILTVDARKRYNERHSKPGDLSIFKFSISDLNLSLETKDLILIYFDKICGKDVSNPLISINPYKDGTGISLERALSIYLDKKEDVYKSVGNINIFNGFVQTWENLIKEAELYYEGNALNFQKEFFYAKQMDGLVASLTLFNIPDLFNEELYSKTNASRKNYEKKMNQAMDVFWRLASNHLKWDSPVIHQGYDNIPSEDIIKSYIIWHTVQEEFKSRLSYIDAEKAKEISGNLYSFWYRPKEESKCAEETPEKFYKKMKEEGYHFEGVVTTSGLGINEEDRDKAKQALKHAWRKLPQKTVIVCGGTGNKEFGNLSGVSLVYEVAEEMGFKTMGIMCAKGFNYPLHPVDYLITKGANWSQESSLLYLFSDSMTAFTGGPQAAEELRVFVTKVKEDISKKGKVTIVKGIKSYMKNNKGSYTGTIDSPEIIKFVETLPKGKITIIDANNTNPVKITKIDTFLTTKRALKNEWCSNNLKRELIEERLEYFFQHDVKPLLDIFENEINSEKWNEFTWEAFQFYSKIKHKSEFQLLSSAEKILHIYNQGYKNTNLEVLELLLKIDEFLDQMKNDLSDNLTSNEKNAYLLSIHNIGYYGEQYSRTQNSKDILLPVDKGGSLNNDGFINGFDILTVDARKRYNERHSNTGDSSIVKFSISDLNLSLDTKHLILMYFKNICGKDVSNSLKSIDPYKDGKGVSLEAALNLYLDKKEGVFNLIGNINFFNGFVQPFENLIKEAELFYEGNALKLQKEFLYAKQMDGLASSLLVFNIDSLFAKGLSATTPATRKDFEDDMNRIISIFWRVSNPWLNWQDPMISQGFQKISNDQKDKSYKMWKAVWEEFNFRINTIDAKIAEKISKNLYSFWYRPKKENESAEKDPISFYKEMKSKGYHFESVISSFKYGILENDRDKAKLALREAWKDLPEKTIIVCKSGEQSDYKSLSGNDLVFEVAEEMGFLTMNVISARDFIAPLRSVDYLISSGINSLQSQNHFKIFRDQMTLLTGENEEDILEEVEDYIKQLKDDKKGKIKLIRGIQSLKREMNISSSMQDTPTLLTSLFDLLPDNQKMVFDGQTNKIYLPGEVLFNKEMQFIKNKIFFMSSQGVEEFYNYPNRVFIPLYNELLKKLKELAVDIPKLNNLILSMETPNKKVPFWFEQNFSIVLHELILNSIESINKKSRSSGKIEMVVYLTQNNLVIEIKDEGVGFDVSSEKLFESEFSTKTSTLKDTIGLGLYYCKQYIESFFGGKIDIWDSKRHLNSRKKGTTVKISLPLLKSISEGNYLNLRQKFSSSS